MAFQGALMYEIRGEHFSWTFLSFRYGVLIRFYFSPMCPLFRTFFIKCMQFLCASISPDSEEMKCPSFSASQLQINGRFPGHEGQNKVENTYFWANTLEETLHRMYPVFWEHVSSSSSLKGAHCLPLCFQGLLTNVRFKSHVITGTGEGVSARGFCAPVR